MSQDQKPTPITYTFGKIPVYLRERPQWVCWRYALTHNSKGESKWTKVPYQAPRLGAKAISNKRETWATFEQSVAAYQNPTSTYDGIGYCLDVDERIVGIDIDHAVLLNAEGKVESVNDIAKDVMKTMQSYAELSVSGHGIHVFALGEKPEGRCKKGDFEMYGSDRYLTFTGRKIASMPATIEARPEQILAVHTKYLAEEPTKEKADVPPSVAPVVEVDRLTEDEILSLARAAKNGEKFRALFDGDWQKHGYSSQSEAELGLCCMLAFWTGKWADQMDRLFRRSALMREKWDTKRGASTYGADTIEKAIERTTEVYEPSPPRPTLVGRATTTEPTVAVGEENHPGGERFTDREHARLLEAFSAGEIRHADEMGERWYRVGPLRWSLDFKTAIVPYVQRIVNHFFACSDQQRDVADERREKLETQRKTKKGAAA
jgi:putative DNA primase/helicase